MLVPIPRLPPGIKARLEEPPVMIRCGPVLLEKARLAEPKARSRT